MDDHGAALVAELDAVAFGDAECDAVLGVHQGRGAPLALHELGVSVKVELRKVRAGAATRRKGLSPRRLVDDVEVVGQLRGMSGQRPPKR
jgi:hypothetical protein